MLGRWLLDEASVEASCLRSPGMGEYTLHGGPWPTRDDRILPAGEQSPRYVADWPAAQR
jgi:hypothetical protein